MNRAAGRWRVLHPAARSLRANASVTETGALPWQVPGTTSFLGLRSGRLAWGAEPAENGCRLQFVWELPGCPADSHDLRPGIYVDHRMISTGIRFDSNRVVPYSPSRYPHGTAPKSHPPGSATSRSIALNSPSRIGPGFPFPVATRQGLPEALPPALAANSKFRVAGLTHGLSGTPGNSWQVRDPPVGRVAGWPRYEINEVAAMAAWFSLCLPQGVRAAGVSTTTVPEGGAS